MSTPPVLRRASFNGIPFWVMHGDIESGHRVSTTGVPGGTHINESFGPSARKFEVEAYVAGDSIAFADALLAAAETMHFGVLVLPDQFGAQVRLTKAKRRFERAKLGFIVVSLEAVAEPDGFFGGLSAFGFDQRIFAAASAMISLFSAGAAGLADASPGVADAARSAALDAVSDLAAIAQLTRLAPAAQEVVSAALSTAADAASFVVSDSATFGTALAEAAIALGDQAQPSQLAETLRLLGAPTPAPLPADSSTTSTRIAAVQAAGIQLTASARALALGESQPRAEWSDRPSALQSRALSAAVFQDALRRLGRENLALHRALSEMQGLVTDRATARAATLAPLVTVAAPRRLPSLVWSWRLYATPTRGSEITSRAGTSHPGFMPERFEALAS